MTMNMKYLAICMVLLVVSIAGCGGGKSISPDFDEPSLSADDSLDVTQLAEKRPATLADLVSYSASQQYSSLDSIYNRPPEDMTENYYIQLSEGNELVNLADRVTAYTQHGNVLAAGFQTGVVNIYGGTGCAAVQTDSSPVNDVSWFPQSNVLAATSGDNSVVEVFKIKECARVRGVSLNSTVDMFTVSPKGSWLAVVDEARRLFVGSPEGKMTQIYRFLHKPLSLSFSDGEGILMAVDVTGQLNMWSPLKLSRIFEFKIKGGPFSSVVADGPNLNITTEKGEKFRWDVSRKARSSYHEKTSGFSVKNGVLSYLSPRKRLSRKVFFKPVELQVERSGSARLLRVKDVDGEYRLYSETTGMPLKINPDLADWKKVDFENDYAFSIGGQNFALAEPVAQREFQRLYCRYIPSKGYYLWWKKVARPDDYFKSRGMLPRREGISVRVPLNWTSIEDGRVDIRD